MSVASNTSNIIYLDKYYQETIDNIVYIKKVLKPTKRQYSYFILKEVEAMSLLKDSGISPQVMSYGKYWIIMTYEGEKVNVNNIPDNWKYQVENILNVLEEKNISHNDIQCEELLVKDKKISLIDFQHWTHGREEFNKLLKEGKIKHRVRTEDRYSMFLCLQKIWRKKKKILEQIIKK